MYSDYTKCLNKRKFSNPIVYEKFMRYALSLARAGVKKGQTPFGACIVKDNKVLSTAHNKVWAKTDITAHAEIMAIEKACRRLNSIDLSNCVIYTTCEPCPMCFSACHWARISSVVYGVSIKDAKRVGFNELIISCLEMKKMGRSKITLIGGMLRKENLKLMKQWAAKNRRLLY